MATEPNLAETAAGDLIARIQSGDNSAEEELVLKYQRAVLAIARVRTRDPQAARDISQDVFIAVLGALRLGRLREPEKLSAFIQGTTRNLVNNFLRVRTHRAESDLEEVEIRGVDPVPDLESSERRQLLWQELAKCSALDQQILLMSLVDGHSLAVVAQRLNISHDLARARKSRIVRKITEKFAGVSHIRPLTPHH
jgi:RNA polymerase sigma factor (sigma-70 family)